MKKLIIPRSLNRFVKFYDKNDGSVPKALFEAEIIKPSLEDFPYPLPSAKSEYTCFAEQDGVMWYGATTGLTRYDAVAERKSMRVMYFSADRDLLDNNVERLYVDGDTLWVLTKTGVAAIEMRMLSADEKAEMLTEESHKYASRRGMMSGMRLAEARKLESVLSYGECDNDGGFTAGYVIGEIYKYAYMKREYGKDDVRTIAARKSAMDGLEVCLLIMNIPGRADGFIARTYLTKDEPVPDGLFYAKHGDTATCIANESSLSRGIAGKIVDASVPVPDRLAKHYRDYGYTDDEVIYKGDTSSDEVTLHFMMMKTAIDLFVEDDEELREIIVNTADRLMSHICDHDFTLTECDGNPTTWAKWNEAYFNTEDGWADAPLNSQELLMYLLVSEHITGNPRWRETYNYLINEKGYADLGLLHYDRFFHVSQAEGCDPAENMMYGDNMLCVMSFWGLLSLEKDPILREKYIKSLRTWDHTLLRETTPGYFFTLKSVYDDMPINEEDTIDWFIHFNPSRLPASVSATTRADVPKRQMPGGYCETGYLLQPDERYIAKFDRDPLEFKNVDSGGVMNCESCFVYTLSYWVGKYYGFIG